MVDLAGGDGDAGRPCEIPSAPLLTSAASGRWRGLQIWMPHKGKTLFEDMSHLGLQVLDAESPADLKRGAIVLPYPYAAMLSYLERSLERLRALWSPELAESVRSGRIRIILDASAEGIEHSPPLM